MSVKALRLPWTEPKKQSIEAQCSLILPAGTKLGFSNADEFTSEAASSSGENVVIDSTPSRRFFRKSSMFFIPSLAHLSAGVGRSASKVPRPCNVHRETQIDLLIDGVERYTLSTCFEDGTQCHHHFY
jgi:hypothetical protein